MTQPSMQRVSAISFSLLLLWMVAALSSAIRISDCDKTQTVKYLEGRDFPNIHCYGSGDNTSTITWTLLDSTATTKLLATCEGLNNCTTSYSSSVLRVYWSFASNSRIYLPHVGREFSGTVTCTETSRTSTESATCELKVTRSRFQCGEEGSVLREGGNGYFYCDHSYYTPRTVTWKLTTNSGVVLDLGSCSNSSDCTSPQGSNTTLYLSSSYSRLYIRSPFPKRSFAGKLSCSFRHNHTTDIDTCPLEIYYPPTLWNCGSDISHGNWSFIIFCDVTKFWSSKGRYEFRVQEDFDLKKRDVKISADTFTFEGRRSFRELLSPYTDPTDNKQYYRGRLTYSWPISPVPGIYHGFRVYTYPNGQSTYLQHPMNLTSPTKPTHNCTDHGFIRGTEVAPCVCSTDNLGSPAGRLVWLLGDSAMVTGAYGVKELRFPSKKLTNGHNGMTARCELDWVKPLTVSLPFVLNVNITVHQQQSPQQSDETQMKGVAIAGWTLFAVVAVAFVTVVVIVLIKRRGSRGTCCCVDDTYDHPKRETNNEYGYYSDLDVTQSARETGSNKGTPQNVTERVYQNVAMGQEGHM